LSRPRFYVPAARAESSSIALPADEAHHLRHVLRLGIDADISIFDGAGHEWHARVASVPRRGDVVCELIAPIAPIPEPPVALTLAIAVLKGDQMDEVVRDVTAMGVREIVPVITDHVAVPRRTMRSGQARDRWQRVAVAASKQCGRAVVPQVRSQVALPAVFESIENAIAVMCVEPAACREITDVMTIDRPSRAIAIVGPEGGWSAPELDLAERQGARFLTLGPRTLRAETAPTVLLAALWTAWGW